MENKKGAKKSFFNLFNLLTVFIVVAGLAAALYFFVLKEEPAPVAETVDVEYIVEIKGVRDEFTDKIEDGDPIADSAGQISIGTVEEIEYARSYSYELDSSSGELVVSERPEHSDVIVTVRAKATVGETGYDINGCVINVGTPVYAKFPNFVGTGHCISIKIVND